MSKFFGHANPFELYITPLNNSDELGGEWIRFPTTPEHIAEVFQHLGIGPSDWSIANTNSHIYGIDHILRDCEDLDELNYLASKLDELSPDDVDRFAVMIEAGKHCDNMEDLINLCDNLECYDFLEGITDYDELARHYMRENPSLDNNTIDELEDYIDFEQYGRESVKEDEGIFTDNCYVIANGLEFHSRYIGRTADIPDCYLVTTKIQTPLLNDEQRVAAAAELAGMLDTFFRQCDPSYAELYPVGWRKLSAINLIIMQQAFNELKSDASRIDSRRILVDMYNKAIDADLVTKNIALQVNPIVAKDGNTEEARVLTEAETELFLDVSAKNRYRNVYALALETGMRIGELLGLKWSDVDFKKRVIYVRRTMVYDKCTDKESPNCGKFMHDFHDPKTEKGKRKIPMTERAYQILQQQKCWKEELERKGYIVPDPKFEGLVFTTRRNTPISPREPAASMQKLSKKLKERDDSFEPLTPHTLRHTFATRCIERGMNPKTLQVILGHSTIHVTLNLYCHVTDDTLESEMRKFEFGPELMASNQ